MADQLTLIDGPQRIIEDRPEGRLYELAARVEGAIARPTLAQIGPAVNALYAQTLVALRADPSLGGRASDIREGGSDLTALEIDISQEPYSGAAGLFALNLVVPYWQSQGATALREPILAALTAALSANVPGPGPAVREQVLAAFQQHLEAALGVSILRNADRPMDGRGPTPIIVFAEGNQGANYETLGRAFYFAHAAVEIFLPGRDTAALDALVQQVLAAVQSANQLGGLALDVVESDTDPDVLKQEYTGPLLAGRVEVELMFATPVGNPYEVAA